MSIVSNPKKNLKTMFDTLTGKTARKGSDAEAEDALDKMTQAAENMQLEDYKPITYEQYATPDVLTSIDMEVPDALTYEDVDARLADTVLAGPTAYDGISTDPRLQEAQMAALNSLQDIANNGGMTAMDKANLSRVQMQTAQADRGRREAILQNMNARGMGGSGAELLAQLQSSQGATDRQAQEGLDIAGMAQLRALDAMARGGSLAGDIRGQDFGEQEAIARARDAINTFNVGQTNHGNQFNTGALNDMTRFNAGNNLQVGVHNSNQRFDVARTNNTNQNEAQARTWNANLDTARGNVDIANNQATHNNYTVPKANNDNQMTKTNVIMAPMQTRIGYFGQRGDKEQEGIQNLVSGAIQGGSTMAGRK
jgi:hypothetical protein